MTTKATKDGECNNKNTKTVTMAGNSNKDKHSDNESIDDGMKKVMMATKTTRVTKKMTLTLTGEDDKWKLMEKKTQWQ